MEQSRITNQQSSQGAHAAVRAKGATKTANDAVQDPAAQGGFMALMAALGDGLPADDATEPSDIGAIIDPLSAAAGQMYDPAALSNVQGFLASALGSAAPSASTSGLPGAVGQAGGDGLVGSSRVAWALDPMGDGLVAQTAVLDKLGDAKDGDTAAGLLAQGRPTLARGTTSFAQRSEALSALAGTLAGKSGGAELGKSSNGAADAATVLSGALASVAPTRESGVVHAVREGLGGRESLGLAGLDSAAVLAELQGSGGAESWLRDSSDVGAMNYGGEGGWGAQALEPDAARSDGGTAVAGGSDGLVPPGAEDALAEQVTYWVNQKTQNAEMTLTRDGQPVEVSVSLSGNEAHVTFRSDQEQTRQMLDGSMAQLSDMLRDQGLILSGASVGTSARDGQSRGGEAQQGSDSRTGQAKVVAADSATERKPAGVDGRRALDVFV